MDMATKVKTEKTSGSALHMHVSISDLSYLCCCFFLMKRQKWLIFDVCTEKYFTDAHELLVFNSFFHFSKNEDDNFTFLLHK